MAKATLISKATPPTAGTPEYKVEGKPYRAAKAGMPSNPGKVSIEMTVEDAQALYVILGHGVCTAGNTSKSGAEVYSALLEVGMGRGNPFVWNIGDPAVGHGRHGHGYLTDTRLPPRSK
jgi:hypothetical protein